MIDWRRRAQRLLSVAAIGCAATLTFAASPPQPAPGLIPINVSVIGPDGASVTQLGREDFEVLTDNAPRPIESFLPPSSPVSLVVLFDMSASLEAYGDLRSAIEHFIVPAKLADDRLKIGAVARRWILSEPFSASANEINAAARKVLAVRDQDKTGPSPIWDAMDAAITALEAEPGRRAMLLVTDGRATGNRIGAADMAVHAVAANVAIQVLAENRPLVIPQGGDRAVAVQPAVALRRIATETGGLCLPEQPVPNGEPVPEPGPLLAQLVRDLRDMYTLGIASHGAPGSFHTVTVRVKRPGLTVRARRSFQTPGAAIRK